MAMVKVLVAGRGFNSWQGVDFKIEFEDGSSATFCVAVRDKNNAVEYLG
jgi:hypothetical protein